MTKAWAKFIGWQYFENKKGWKPLFQLFLEPPTIMNGTTVGLDTLKKYDVEIPYYPPFKPDTSRKQMTLFYCSCGLTYAVKQSMIEHIKETYKDWEKHKTSMESVTIADLSDDGKPQQNKVVMVQETKKVMKEAEKTTPDLIVAQAEKEALEDAQKQFEEVKPAPVNQELSPWARSMYKQYKIPLPKEAK